MAGKVKDVDEKLGDRLPHGTSIVILYVSCILLEVNPQIKNRNPLGSLVVAEASNTRLAKYSFLACVPIYV